MRFRERMSSTFWWLEVAVLLMRFSDERRCSGSSVRRCRSPYEIQCSRRTSRTQKTLGCRSPYEIPVQGIWGLVEKMLGCRSPYEILSRLNWCPQKYLFLQLPFSLWDSSNDKTNNNMRIEIVAVLLMRFSYIIFDSSGISICCRSPYEILKRIEVEETVYPLFGCRSPYEIRRCL